MKCQVYWVKDGKATPDNNDAVMMAHFHEPIWGTPGPNNRIQGYGDIRESFPICAEHYAMVDASFRFPRGGWTFTPLPMVCHNTLKYGLQPDTCDHCKRTIAGTQSACPFHYEVRA